MNIFDRLFAFLSDQLYDWSPWRLKAKIRDWAFSDYKWITRAQVQREIACLMWENRDRPYVIRQFRSLQKAIR